jgi:hypothetical protein
MTPTWLHLRRIMSSRPMERLLVWLSGVSGGAALMEFIAGRVSLAWLVALVSVVFLGAAGVGARWGRDPR